MPGSASFADFGSSVCTPSLARLPGGSQGAAKTIRLERPPSFLSAHRVKCGNLAARYRREAIIRELHGKRLSMLNH